MMRRLVTACALAGMALGAQAASTHFQTPTSGGWGEWSRGTSGTAYVHWENFDAFMPVGFPTALPDNTPDRGNFGTQTGNKAPVIIPNNPGAFVTGSGAGGNLYSFSDTNDFDVIIQPLASLGLGPVTVALQVSVLGTDLDDSLMRMNGLSFTEKRVLVTGNAAAPDGLGVGVDNEYLYLWTNYTRASAAQPFVFDLVALGSSNSLDALAVDIGPSSVVIPPVEPPPPAPVPLPASAWLLGAGVASLVGRARRRRDR